MPTFSFNYKRLGQSSSRQQVSIPENTERLQEIINLNDNYYVDIIFYDVYNIHSMFFVSKTDNSDIFCVHLGHLVSIETTVPKIINGCIQFLDFKIRSSDAQNSTLEVSGKRSADTTESDYSVPSNDLGIFAAHSRQGPIDHASLRTIINGPIKDAQPAYIADRSSVLKMPNE